MTPTICDVFSNRNLMLSYLSSHYGNVYVTGNLDLIYCCNPIEIFGDIVVDGVLSGCDIIVHGNIECYDLHCDSIKVDGDILISGHASVSNQMKSFGGNIRILGSADIPNLIASEGSIYVGDKINVNCIKAFDSIYVNGNIIAAAEIIAGRGIEATGNISFDNLERYFNEFVNINVLSGGIRSKNIKIF